MTAFTRLSEGYADHERRLVAQLMEQNGLDVGWVDVIVPLVHKIVEVVRPDVKNENDDMDVRQYVQIKKVSYVEFFECNVYRTNLIIVYLNFS